MSDFGKFLWTKYLETNWALDGETQVAFASAEEIAELFFEEAGPIEKTAAEAGTKWNARAVIELDQKLMIFASSGETKLHLNLSPAGAIELWRRWQYAIMASMLEAAAKTKFSIPYPLRAPEYLAGTAIALWVLGGPAHEYPRRLFSQRKPKT
jgi:hypothetical protein